MFADPTFWVLIAFVLFFVFTFKPLRRVILGGIDGKIAEIKEQVDEAAKLRDEAQALLAEYERKQQQATGRAEEMIAAARKEAEAAKKVAEQDLRASLERSEKLALERISQAEDKALQEVREMAVDLAIAASEKIIAERIAGADGDAIVDRAIKDLPSKLH